MRAVLTIALSTLIVIASSHAGSAECGKDGTDYLRLADKALAARQYERTTDFLSKAAASGCNGHELEMQLGQHLEDDGLYEEALTVYEAAQASATTLPDQALAVAGYAKVLNTLGEPEDALPLLQAARQLDPRAPAWIHALALELDQTLAEQPFTRERVTRSFSTSTMGRLSPGSIKPVNPETNASTTTVKPVAPQPIASLPFRVLFRVNSSTIEASEAEAIAELASGLADPALKDARFWFTGHTDARGDANYNMRLSLARATEVHNQVVALKPELAGRIRTRGMGEDRLLYPNADSESQHRLNRRVEVQVE